MVNYIPTTIQVFSIPHVTTLQGRWHCSHFSNEKNSLLEFLSVPQGHTAGEWQSMIPFPKNWSRSEATEVLSWGRSKRWWWDRAENWAPSGARKPGCRPRLCPSFPLMTEFTGCFWNSSQTWEFWTRFYFLKCVLALQFCDSVFVMPHRTSS